MIFLSQLRENIMSSMWDYKIEFIERTKEILEREFHNFEDKDREVTFLLNCLVGLIVTVSENENRKLEVFKGKIDDHFLALIPKKIAFVEKESPVDNSTDLIHKSVTKLDVQVEHLEDLKVKDKFWLLNKIRNGITHQHINAVNEDKKWVGVRLWNEPTSNMKDFEIIFTIEQLRRFAIEISQKYLSEKNQQQSEQLAMFT